ncbi:MAG TPA: hypothetical protein VJQ52_19925 [Steroidobacteraceae bacterium]|nr:hypothetical protein [Steroidobacteraceae bacterium]
MKLLHAVAIATALTLATQCVFAQTQRTGNADARVLQQVQQLSAERAALQTENANLQQELERARAELEKSKAGAAALEKRTRTLEAGAQHEQTASKQSQDELERTRTQMQELVGKFRETAQTLREIETDRAQVKSRLTTQERELKTCVDRNAGLYNLNTEVLDRMENRGFWSSLSEREPFTRLKRVELENLIDDYRYRADELRLEQQQAGGVP